MPVLSVSQVQALKSKANLDFLFVDDDDPENYGNDDDEEEELMMMKMMTLYVCALQYPVWLPSNV